MLYTAAIAATVGSAAALNVNPAVLRTPPAALNVKMVASLKTKAVGKKADAEFCYGLPGAMAPAGEWDPANLLQDQPKEEVYRWREAELAHGRVGMLAAAGFLVQENFHPLFSGDGGPAIQQIPALPPWIWFLMTLGVGIAESVRIQKGWNSPYELDELGRNKIQTLKPDYYPGDLGFDPLGLKPEEPAEFRIMQEKELAHGRLAMLAAAGFIAQEAVTGTTWGAQDATEEGLLLGGWFIQKAALTGF